MNNSLCRLSLIQAHLNSKFPDSTRDNSLDNYRKNSPFINKSVLARHYYEKIYDEIVRLRELAEKSDLFNHHGSINFTVEEARKRVMEQLIFYYSREDNSYASDKEDPLKKTILIHIFAENDLGLSTKLTVHLVLYTDSLQVLGTEKHLDYVERAYKLKDIGSFGMTELGHGSNVANVETIATYDATTGGFILNSPTITSAKWWIGAVGNTANMSVIFAQLIVGNSNKGVHVFVVPIRDENNDTYPGVVVGDCGKKIAMDGIDNGFILFKNYKIGYDCLLDRFSQIKDGKFKSSIKNKEKRLGVMMAGLIRGRTCVISGSEINARCALTIATRYSAIRKQFGPNDEVPLLSYQLHRYRLIPGLAKIFAIRSGYNMVFKNYIEIKARVETNPESDELNDLHSLISAVKVLASGFSISIIQECREACGGIAFSIFSGIARYRSYQDAHLTWEGDNNVLIQQTGKYILKVLQKSYKGQKSTSKLLDFLNLDFEEVKRFKCKFTKSEEIESEAFISQFLEYKVNYLMHSSVQRLQEKSMTSPNLTEAWNDSQVFCIQEMGRSFGELMLARGFALLCTRIYDECPKTGEIVKKLYLLYGIDRILSGVQFYHENALTRAQEKILRDMLLKLCDEISPAAVNIIDAIATTDKILGSAIGSTDGQAYKRMIDLVEASPKCYEKPDWIHLVEDLRKKK